MEFKRFLRITRKFEEIKRVKFMILFGSAAEGKLAEESDIDICIYFDGNKKEGEKFRLKLISELPDYFDVKIFNSLALYVRKEVLRESQFSLQMENLLMKFSVKHLKNLKISRNIFMIM